MIKPDTDINYNDRAFYQKECNKRGVRIYPVPNYNMYVLEIEFSRSANFEPYAKQSVVRGDTRYSIKGKEWIEKIYAKYKQIYLTRIKPRLSQGKEVKPGTIRAIYKTAG